MQCLCEDEQREGCGCRMRMWREKKQVTTESELSLVLLFKKSRLPQPILVSLPDFPYSH